MKPTLWLTLVNAITGEVFAGWNFVEVPQVPSRDDNIVNLPGVGGAGQVWHEWVVGGVIWTFHARGMHAKVSLCPHVPMGASPP